MAKFNKINEVYKWRNSTRSNEVYKWRNSTKSMKHINEVKFHKKKKHLMHGTSITVEQVCF